MGFKLPDGIRDRIADRVSNLKKRTGVNTPVIDELPLDATSLDQKVYAQILERPGRIAFPTVLPAMVKGKASGKVAGRWYQVYFSKPIKNPSVVAVAEGRKGDMPENDRFPLLPDIPQVLKDKIPDLTIEKWTIDVLSAERFIEAYKKYFGDWGVFNWMRDAITYVMGHSAHWTWVTFFQPRGVKTLNRILSNVQDRINDRLTKIRNIFNDKLAQVDDRFDAVRGNVNEIIEKMFPRLYEAWGQRQDMALTVAQIRNVTNRGFQFLSMGDTTVHYIALGDKV